MNWYLQPWKKYIDFEGRAQRKEYWVFVLLNFVIVGVLGILDGSTMGPGMHGQGGGVLTAIFGLVSLVPSVAVAVRRLHDTDRSGWWVLISFIPLLGMLVLLVFMLLDGTPGDNRFGSNPKGAEPNA